MAVAAVEAAVTGHPSGVSVRGVAVFVEVVLADEQAALAAGVHEICSFQDLAVLLLEHGAQFLGQRPFGGCKAFGTGGHAVSARFCNVHRSLAPAAFALVDEQGSFGERGVATWAGRAEAQVNAAEANHVGVEVFKIGGGSHFVLSQRDFIRGAVVADLLLWLVAYDYLDDCEHFPLRIEQGDVRAAARKVEFDFDSRRPSDEVPCVDAGALLALPHDRKGAVL